MALGLEVQRGSVSITAESLSRKQWWRGEDTSGQTSLCWHMAAGLMAVFTARYWGPWPDRTGSTLGEALSPVPHAVGIVYPLIYVWDLSQNRFPRKQTPIQRAACRNFLTGALGSLTCGETKEAGWYWAEEVLTATRSQEGAHLIAQESPSWCYTSGLSHLKARAFTFHTFFMSIPSRRAVALAQVALWDEGTW